MKERNKQEPNKY